jgi:hypothetical protein
VTHGTPKFLGDFARTLGTCRRCSVRKGARCRPLKTQGFLNEIWLLDRWPISHFSTFPSARTGCYGFQKWLVIDAADTGASDNAPALKLRCAGRDRDCNAGLQQLGSQAGRFADSDTVAGTVVTSIGSTIWTLSTSTGFSSGSFDAVEKPLVLEVMGPGLAEGFPTFATSTAGGQQINVTVRDYFPKIFY